MSKIQNSDARKGMVPLGSMAIHPICQRPLDQHHVDKLKANYDPALVAEFLVNHRDGKYYVIDGQHSLAVAKEVIGVGWERKHMSCIIFDELDDAQMADLFLRKNETLAVTAYDRFDKGLVAKRDDEANVNKIVKAAGLHFSRNGISEGSVACVSTLLRIYRKLGPEALARAIKISFISFGHEGLGAMHLEGIALVCHRYGKTLSDQRILDKLSMKKAADYMYVKTNVAQKRFKKSRSVSYAIALVELINSGKGGPKLPDWIASGDIA